MKHSFGTFVMAALLAVGAGSGAIADPPRDPCLLLGALTTPAQDVRIFAVDLKHQATSLLGDALPLTDVAGLAVHPATGVLYALVAPHEGAGGFVLVTVDRVTGAVSQIGATGLSRAGGLSIRPTDGTLWTWAQGQGPATVDTGTGAAQVVAASNAVVTDIAWRPDGETLFAAGGRVLWSWRPDGSSLVERSKLPVTAAAVAMRADGRLLVPAPRPESGLPLDAPPGLDSGFSLLIVDPKTGVVDATLAAAPVPIASRPEVAAARVESLTWPLLCGNPSPGGPADLIQSVSAEPSAVCPGGTVRVVVETQHPEGGANPVTVTIAGLPGTSRWVQFEGLPGPRVVSIAASTAEGYHDSESIQVEVRDCGPASVLPVLRIRPDPYRPFVADLEVQNADLVAPPGSSFLWEFGDGTTAEGVVPFVRHSYAASLPRDLEFPGFDAAVTVVRPDNRSLRTRKTATLWNRYAVDKRRGVIRPPVEADEVAPLAATAHHAIQSIEPRSAGYTLRNIEDRSITLTLRQVEHQYCDPARNPLLSDWQPLDVEVAPGASITQRVVLPDDEDICGVAVHLVGTADLLHRVAVDVYFDTRRNPFKTSRVTDGALLDALNAAAPLLPDGDRIFDEELFRLSREKLIPAPYGGDEVPTVDYEPDPYVGQECLPGDAPPYLGVTCQATDEWTTAEPHIRNALKGDVILSTVCGMVGDLLRAVDPPQYYSHSGIMISNHYSVAHSTASSDRYLAYPEGGGDLTNGIREDVLKYGWPGVIRQSVGDAFGTVNMVDPNGASFELHGFSQNPALCPRDEIVTYPMVVRPPAEQAASVRPLLEEAAEVAKNTQHGNYRFYAYTDTRIGLWPEFNWYGPAEMCSGFVWRSLTLAGAVLEGPELEPEDVQSGARVDVEGLMDGLYAYDAIERLNAGVFIYDSVYEQVYTQAGWFGNAVTDAADDLANQLTNCFASDWCSYGAKDSDAWTNPGVGRAASPQDLFYWDSPATGGVYGAHEPLVYRSGDHVRVYRWARSEGAGDVRGTVRLNADEFPGARVVLYADQTRETESGPDGSFSFLGVPSGEYEIRAEKLDGNLLLEATGTVTVPPDGTGTITLTLTPPPEYLRRLTFEGTYVIVDDEWPADNETGSGNFYEVCSVDPYARTAEIRWERCVGAEVLIRIDISCALMPDDRSVSWSGQGLLYEGVDCDPDDLDGSFAYYHEIGADQAKIWNILLHNDDPGEPDGNDTAVLTLTVTNGIQ